MKYVFLCIADCLVDFSFEKERRDRKHDLLMWSEMHQIYCSEHNRGVTENFANFKRREQ